MASLGFQVRQARSLPRGALQRPMAQSWRASKLVTALNLLLLCTWTSVSLLALPQRAAAQETAPENANTRASAAGPRVTPHVIPAVRPSSNCLAFPIDGRKFTFPNCVSLDSEGKFRLWWRTNVTANVSTVAFMGPPEVPYAWAGWGISPNGSGYMLGSYAFVAYGEDKGMGVALARGNIFYLGGYLPQKVLAGVTNGPVSIVGDGIAVEWTRNGQLVKMLTRVSGLAGRPMTVIWRGGSSVLNFTRPLLGAHRNRTFQAVRLSFDGPRPLPPRSPPHPPPPRSLPPPKPPTPNPTQSPPQPPAPAPAPALSPAPSPAQSLAPAPHPPLSPSPAPPPAQAPQPVPPQYVQQKTTHAGLAGFGFGVLIPIGVLVARHVKVWVDPLWFFIHMGIQLCGYILGVAGWGYGMWLKSKYVGDFSKAPSWQYSHYSIGITIFCLATLQIFTPILKPHQGEPVRIYWNVVHWLLGYTTIILSFAQVFLGFQNLSTDGIGFGSWRTGYIVFICIWIALMILLEPLSWWKYTRNNEEYDDEDDDEEYDDDEDDDDYDDDKPKKHKKRHDDDDDEDDDDEDDDDEEEGDDEEEEDDDDNDGDDDDEDEEDEEEDDRNRRRKR